jgi:copper(I)-binding protein
VTTQLRRHRLATGLLAVATALTVSACGASLDAQTYQERNNAESTNAATGALALRNVAVKAPADGVHSVGDDATVVLTVTNAANQEDRLLEVTSSAARRSASSPGGASARWSCRRSAPPGTS